MKFPLPAALALALAAAFPSLAVAQSNAELLNELKALKDRIGQLEEKLKAADAAAKPAEKQWGMTPEQAAEQNRIRVKTESIEDNLEAQGFKGLKINGQMDPTFLYNRAQRRAGFQFLNSVDNDLYNYDNSYFGMAMIDFQKEMEGGTRWRLTLAPNRGVGSVFDSASRSPVHEASVSVPLTDLQTRLIAGQIPDWSGYEYLQPTLNKLITHNLLFDFTLPTAYTGAGLEVTSGKWIVKGVVANLNASKRSAGEKTPVIAYRVDYSRGEYQGFGFAGVHGKAPNFRADDGVGNPVTALPYDLRDTAVHLVEVDGYFIRGDLTVQGQVSFGTQKNAAVTADPITGELRNSQWAGVSALAAYKFMPRLEGIVRGDYLRNKKNGGGLLGYTFADGRNGIGPNPGSPENGANRYALSVGMQYLFNLNTTFKAEYRMDRASEQVFEYGAGSGNLKKSNHVLGGSMVLSF
jgi:Protein of unknown function (DUF3138)